MGFAKPIAIVVLLLAASDLWAAAAPKNLVNPETPVSARCVTADGTGFESCAGAGGAGGDGKILDGTAAGQADVMSSAPAGTEEGLVVRQAGALPAGTNLIGKVGIDQSTPGTTHRVDDGTFADNEPFHLNQVGGTVVTTDTTQPANAKAAIVVRQPVSCTNRIAVSQTADTQVVTGTAGQRIYICAIMLIASAAETINIIEGTGTVCATSPTALYGSTTEANGMALAANGGFSQASGQPFVHTGVDGNNLCITQVGTARIAGSISFIVAAD